MEDSEIISKLKNAQDEIDEIIQLINNGKLSVINDNNEYSVLKLLEVEKLWKKDIREKE